MCVCMWIYGQFYFKLQVFPKLAQLPETQSHNTDLYHNYLLT